MIRFFKLLIKIIFKLNSIMANLQDVENQINSLKVSVDTLQTNVTTVISQLQASIDAGTGISNDDAVKLIAELQAIQSVVENISLTTTTTTTIV